MLFRSRIKIGTVDYDVAERISNTVVTLQVGSNPGADVAAGQSFTAYRPTHFLPSDFRRMISLTDLASKIEPSYVEAIDINRQQIYQSSNSVPTMYTIHNMRDTYGNAMLELGPYPMSSRSYSVVYERSPRLLLVEGYAKGLVTTSGTTVTGSGGASFEDAHVGAIIRFSQDATQEPTGTFGYADGSYNPFFAQRVIMQKNSSTQVVLDAALPSDVTGVRYVISDPLDVMNQSMVTYVLRAAELEMARMSQRKDKQEFMMFERQALEEAMAADLLWRELGMPVTWYPFHLQPWTTVPAEVVGGKQ